MNEMTIIFHSQVSQYLYDRIEIEFIFFEFVRPLEFLFEISLGDIPSGSINNVFLFLLSQNQLVLYYIYLSTTYRFRQNLDPLDSFPREKWGRYIGFTQQIMLLSFERKSSSTCLMSNSDTYLKYTFRLFSILIGLYFFDVFMYGSSNECCSNVTFLWFQNNPLIQLHLDFLKGASVEKKKSILLSLNTSKVKFV